MSDATEGGSSAAAAATATATASAVPGRMTSIGLSSLPAAELHTYRCSCATGTSWSCNDDPPPYASLVEPSESTAEQQQHRQPWHYVCQGYGLAQDGTLNGENNRAIARPLVNIPLTSYRIFKIEPPCYAAATRQMQNQHHQLLHHHHHQHQIVPELGSSVKSSSRSNRKYSALLIAATVIVFLMALSLMVRLVTEKSFWKG